MEVLAHGAAQLAHRVGVETLFLEKSVHETLSVLLDECDRAKRLRVGFPSGRWVYTSKDKC